MAKDEIRLLAARMLADYDARTPSELFSRPIGLTIPQSYELQGEIAGLREQRGEQIIGYKVGCTSRAIQDQLGIREPIFSRVFDGGCFPSGSGLAYDSFASLAIEGELAIRLSRDLPRDSLSDQEYVESIGSVFPVIELHHYVLPTHGTDVAALIASGGMHAGFVLAEQETMCSGRVHVVDALDVAIDDRLVGMTREPWTMGGPATNCGG